MINEIQNPKYEILSDEVHEVITQGEPSRKVYRIRASRDFGTIKAGELGGFIESEANLDHDGYCWVSDDAVVCGSSRVRDNAWVGGDAIVRNGYINHDGKVLDNAEVYGGTVTGIVRLYAEIHNGVISGFVTDNAKIYGGVIPVGAEVYGTSVVKNMRDVLHVRPIGSVHSDITIAGENLAYNNIKMSLTEFHKNGEVRIIKRYDEQTYIEIKICVQLYELRKSV